MPSGVIQKDLNMQNKQYLQNGLKNVGPKKRKKTNYIVITSTDTPNYLDVTLSQLDKQHRQEGVLGLKDHFIITLDGKVHTGREQEVIGFDIGDDALSIRLVGKDNFNIEQTKSLQKLIKNLKQIYKEIEIDNTTTIEI